MKTDFSLDDMRLFCTLAQAGSYRQAAETLAMPVSTLSRRITLLEERLKVRLLHRDAHRLTLTDTGQQYVERCAPLVEELSEVSHELHAGQRHARGNIRISAPVDISLNWLGDVLNLFAAQYPHIHLNMNLSNHNIDLSHHSIDLAIRVGDQQASDWVQRHLVDLPFAFYCAPGQPQWQTLTELAQLDEWPLILGRPVQQWRLHNPVSAERALYRPGSNARITANNVMAATRAVAAGLGVSLLPRSSADEFCRRGELVRINTPWEGEPRPVFMLYRDRNNQPYRLRLLIDFISLQFSPEFSAAQTPASLLRLLRGDMT